MEDAKIILAFLVVGFFVLAYLSITGEIRGFFDAFMTEHEVKEELDELLLQFKKDDNI